MKLTPGQVEALVAVEIDNPAYTRRSPQYRLGVKECLLTRFCGVRFTGADRVESGGLKPGTPEFDAYEAGYERGWVIYRAWCEQHPEVIS